MNLTSAAIEAAAQAIYECQPLHGFPSGEVISWNDLTAGAFAKRGLMMEQARAALEAGAPHICPDTYTQRTEWPDILGSQA